MFRNSSHNPTKSSDKSKDKSSSADGSSGASGSANVSNGSTPSRRKSSLVSLHGSAEAEIFDEVLSGIKLYFDRALGNILLYRFERQQYLQIKQKFPDKSLCDIYGAEHLLRLFVSFPALIAQTNMDQQSIVVLREHLEEFLKFMVENRRKLFLTEYESTSPQYEAVSRSF